MTKYITEPEFAARIRDEAAWLAHAGYRWITGPGRSGSIAAVYMSHAAGIPHVPYGSPGPAGTPGIVIDTATLTGATLRKAGRRYPTGKTIALYDERETGRIIFWYERDFDKHINRLIEITPSLR